MISILVVALAVAVIIVIFFFPIDTKYSFATKWGSQGNGDGQFNNPDGVAVDSSNNIYVADFYNNRIQKFDNNGRFIAKWGSQGIEDGQFRIPAGVAVDSSNNIYVVGNFDNRIQKFVLRPVTIFEMIINSNQ